jgi:hypothetical protein
LQRILGIFLIPEHAPTQAVDLAFVAVHQCFEGLIIPPSDSGDKVLIRKIQNLDAFRPKKVQIYWEAIPAKFLAGKPAG